MNEKIYNLIENEDGTLTAVSGTVCIPASVTKIENEYGLGHKIIAICRSDGVRAIHCLTVVKA